MVNALFIVQQYVHVDDTYEQLHGKLGSRIMMVIYYSSIDGEEKKKKLKLWKNNAIQLMIATNAFGMGLNDKNVRLVIHYAFPLNIGKKDCYINKEIE